MTMANDGGGEMTHRPMYLGHVNIYVRDAERSHKWYEEVLGLHTYHKRPGWAAFMAADLHQSHEVALIQLGDPAPPPHPAQPALNPPPRPVHQLAPPLY